MKNNKLPHGTLTTLAKEFCLSPSTIKNMLDGKYIHDRQIEIFKRATEIKNEYGEKVKQVRELQNSLINN